MPVARPAVRNDLAVADVHDDMAAWLDTNERESRKLILIPRGHMKSSIITVGKTIQKLLLNPDLRILIANAIWDNARGFVGQIASYMGPGTPLSKMYGEFKPVGR